MSSKKYYAVVFGRSPGIYTSWYEAEKQISGFAGALHKSFKTYEEATRFFPPSTEFCDCDGTFWLAIEGFQDGNTIESDRLLAEQLSQEQEKELEQGKGRQEGQEEGIEQRIGNTSYTDTDLPPPYPQNGSSSSALTNPANTTTNNSNYNMTTTTTTKTTTSTPLKHNSKSISNIPTSTGSSSTPFSASQYSATSSSSTTNATPSRRNNQLNASIKTSWLELIATYHQLTPEQKTVVELVRQKQNVFMTGSGGVGKSFLIEYLVKELQLRGIAVEVTATTGIASTNIGATTIHSWAGIGLGNRKPDDYFFSIVRNGELRKRWTSVKVLILDEVSMLTSDMFELLDTLGRRVRAHHFKNDDLESVPFGGIQLVLCGDFLQLPPIDTVKCPTCHQECKERRGDPRPDLLLQRDPVTITRHCEKCKKIIHFTPKFPFETNSWQLCNLRFIELTIVKRQENQEFVKILNDIRIGNLSPTSERVLRNCCVSSSSPPKSLNGESPVIIAGYRNFVDRENEAKFNQIKGDEYRYEAFGEYLMKRDRPTQHQEDLKNLKIMPPEKYSLKKGVKVLLLINLDHTMGLVNGSQGTVVDFVDYPDHESDHAPEFTTFAVAAETKSRRTGEDAKLALTRRFRPTVDKWKRHCAGAGGSIKLPVVEFTIRNRTPTPSIPDRFIKTKKVIYPHVFASVVRKEVVAWKVQLPLTLGYALTVHKCQGLTLDNIDLHFGTMFTKGQAYVALSRVTSLEGLTIRGFAPNKIVANQVVVGYYGTEREKSRALVDSMQGSLKDVSAFAPEGVFVGEDNEDLGNTMDGLQLVQDVNRGMQEAEDKIMAEKFDNANIIPATQSSDFDLPNSQQPEFKTYLQEFATRFYQTPFSTQGMTLESGKEIEMAFLAELLVLGQRVWRDVVGSGNSVGSSQVQSQEERVFVEQRVAMEGSMEELRGTQNDADIEGKEADGEEEMEEEEDEEDEDVDDDDDKDEDYDDAQSGEVRGKKRRRRR